jgi:hypothetical protein
MRDPRGLDPSGALQFNVFGTEMLEQSPTGAEQYGHQVNLYSSSSPACKYY